jgi:hypothetical protein
MIDIKDYDDWSQHILQNLQTAGKEGVATTEYILDNKVKIVTIENNATNMWWRLKIGLHGLQIQNTLYVSRFIADKHPDDPWALMLFVHETRHLQQGFRTAFSVYGEMEAWQLGFRIYQTLPNHGPVSQFVEDLLKLPLCHDASVLKQAQQLINLDQNGGASFKEQIYSILKREKSFNDYYWIYALPLNPLFSLA